MAKTSNSYTGGSASKRKRSGSGGGSPKSGGIGKLLLGMVLGAVGTVATVGAYLSFSKTPVAVTDKPALWEHVIESTAVRHRIQRDAKQPPFPASEDAFEAGARTYRAQCAHCHGTPGHESEVGRQMLPHAAQFFGRDRRSTAAKPAGEIFWPTANGIRRTGMPAYNRTLTNTQMWQVALLLHSANEELPEPVNRLLTESAVPPPPMAEHPKGSIVVPY